MLANLLRLAEPRSVGLLVQIIHAICVALSHRLRIPAGFRPKAQGCEERATLGHRPTNIINRNAVAAISFPHRLLTDGHNLVEVVRFVRFV